MEFSSLVLDSGGTEYVSGSVEGHKRYAISEQGARNFTTSVTDLAIKGQGFFVVSSENGQTYLTRAGSFVPDGVRRSRQRGRLQADGIQPGQRRTSVVANGAAGSRSSTSVRSRFKANASTAGSFNVNLPFSAAVVVPANLPSANAATAQYTG